MRGNGFTLIEILVVVIILGILAAVVIPKFSVAEDDARDTAVRRELQQVRSQLQLYRVHHGGAYPTDIKAQLTTATNSDGTAGGSLGPYLQKFPSNPFVPAAADTVDTDAKGGGNAGWYYDASTGEFTADDDAHSNL